MLLLTVICAAQAQPVPEIAGNVQTLHPSVDGRYALWTDDAATAPNGALRGRTVLSYTSAPLVWDSFFGQRAVVDSTWQLDVIASGSWGPARIGLDVPLLLAGSSDVIEGATTGLGDLAADGKLTLLDPAKRPMGLALTGRVSLPTATVALPLGGETVGWELAGVLEVPAGPARILTNVGTRGGQPTRLGDVEVDDQFVLRAAGVLPVGQRGGATLEIAAHLDYAAPFGAGSPVEFVVGGWGWLTKEWSLRGGLGRGLPGAIGSPRARLLVALAYEPEKNSRNGPTPEPIVEDPEPPSLSPGATGVTVQRQGTVTLQLRIRDNTGAVVQGAYAWLQCEGTDVRLPPVAEIDVLPGVCDLNVMAPGWDLLTEQIQVPAVASHARVVILRPAEPMARLVVEVVDRLSRPVTTATWHLVEGEVVLPIEDGHATLALKPGTYALQVSAEGYESARHTYELTAGEERSWRVVLQRARMR